MVEKKSKGRRRMEDTGVIKVWQEYGGDAIEIANIYGIHITTVYDTLRDYCKFNSISYKELLRVPHKKHIRIKKSLKGKYIMNENITIGKITRSLKSIKEAIRYGKTAEEIAKKFEVSSEIFIENLQQRTGNFYEQEYGRLLDANERNRQKHSKQNTNNEECTDSIPSEKDVTLELLQNKLSELLSKKSNIEISINGNKEIIKGQEINVNQIKDKKAKAKSQIEELLNYLKTLEDEQIKVNESLVALEEEQRMLFEALNETEVNLKNTNANIKALQNITVTMQSGIFVISDKDFMPQKDDINEKFLYLASMQEYKEYTVSELNNYATLLLIKEMAELFEKEVVIDFEKSEFTERIKKLCA